MVSRREGEATSSASLSRTSHCCRRGPAARQADAEHEGERLFLARLLQREPQIPVILEIEPVELGELAARLGNRAGGGVGHFLGDGAAQMMGSGLERFVRAERLGRVGRGHGKERRIREKGKMSSKPIDNQGRRSEAETAKLFYRKRFRLTGAGLLRFNLNIGFLDDLRRVGVLGAGLDQVLRHGVELGLGVLGGGDGRLRLLELGGEGRALAVGGERLVARPEDQAREENGERSRRKSNRRKKRRRS